MTSRKLTIERLPEGVIVLTLNDPSTRNAIGIYTAEILRDARRTIGTDTSVRALVITGAGGSFCSGADLNEVLGRRDLDAPAMRAFLREYYDGFLWIREVPFPTIAAVDGPAVGAGLNLALACDIRLAGPTASFGATFTRLGIHPGGGCTSFLVATLGRQRALRILLEGRTLDAEEAVSCGVADELVPDAREAALALALRFAALEPTLARDVKRAVTIAETAGFVATLEFEAWSQGATTADGRASDAVASTRAREKV